MNLAKVHILPPLHSPLFQRHAAQHIQHLLYGHLVADMITGYQGQLKRPFIQAPVIDAKPLILVHKNLKGAPRPIQEDKYISGDDVLVQFRSDQCRQPIEGPGHLYRLSIQVMIGGILKNKQLTHDKRDFKYSADTSLYNLILPTSAKSCGLPGIRAETTSIVAKPLISSSGLQRYFFIQE